LPCQIQQDGRADDVGLNEGGGIVDGAIDMCFRSQMDDCVRGELAHPIPHARGVGDIELDKSVVRFLCDRLQGIQVGLVCQLVHVQDQVTELAHHMPAYCGADESRAAGDENAQSRCGLTASHLAPRSDVA
jgi:hypothetical protein